MEKVRDIIGLYLNPPDKAMVLCVAVCRPGRGHRRGDYSVQTLPPAPGALGFLRQIEKSVPEGLDVHLIVDNSCTHKHAVDRRSSAQR